MDDLLSEDWQKPVKATTSAPSNPSAFASNYSSFRASPQPQISGTASPQNLSRPSSTVNGAKPAANDTFGNLLSLKTRKASNNVSIQERQKQLLEEKRRQQEQQTAMWDNLGSGRGTPEIRQPSPAVPTQDDEDDFLAAFNKDAPVNRASYFSPPPPSGDVSGRSTPCMPLPISTIGTGFDEDDDPFGLNEVSKKSNGHSWVPNQFQSDPDDILGDLGKPVTAKPAAPSPAESQNEPILGEDDGTSGHSFEPVYDGGDALNEPALAELLDMGFPADTARIALSETGGDVQNAVGWLLQQAHEESRQKSRGEMTATRQQSTQTTSRSPQRRPQRTDQEAMPAWMRQEGRPSSTSRRQVNGSNAAAEKDATQVAQDFGNKLFKSANSLWKASQKQMAKTVAEFHQDSTSEPNQPKWMRSAGASESEPPRRRQQDPTIADRGRPPVNTTEEAAALDAPRERPQKPPRPSAPPSELSSKNQSPVDPLPHRPSSQPKFMQQIPLQPDRRPVAKLSRQEVEDQSSQAYISPARRKRPTPKPEPVPEPEVDFFNTTLPAATSPAPASRNVPPHQLPRQSQSTPSPAPKQSKAPPRTIPSISSVALASSASHRKIGGEHFKRGDFGAAHESYTAALTPLPPTHPIAIVVLSNRSLTALKNGDAKVAVSDADRALEIIGPGLGAGEVVDLGNGEGTRDIKDLYGKVLMRKAEALEHMEKYSDAATVWRQAVEAGVGGAVSIQGRNRCEKAVAPRPSVAASSKPVRSAARTPGKAPPTKSLGNSLERPTIPSVASQEAVKKLRAANADAEREDDEKFALADSVDAKLAAWRGGKTDNLRALLQSMDVVLWESAGWKKVGMSDLVVPSKVKIIYMKAIGKVHPDKIPQDATTEQRMISAAVFSTLNEAWDKFKTDNNL